MRADEPSRTARGVAVARARVDRIPWPTGDAEADDRLTSEVIGDWAPAVSARPSPDAIGLVAWIELRTRFFDRVVTDALSAGIDQIVSLGAGYDGRAVRYRTPGVRFFEVDHPATQADKLARYAAVGAPTDGITFVTADFIDGDLDGALARAGHDPTRPTQYTCEGVLRYLPEDALRGLLTVAARRAADGSRLATTFSTREGAPTDRDRTREVALAAAGEPVLTVPPVADAFAWITAAGWSLESVEDPLTTSAGPAQHGRLLIDAVRRPGRPDA